MRLELAAATTSGAITDPIRDPILRRAILELALVGIGAGTLGCWVVLYGFSYSAESLSHALFPGLVLATLLGAPLVIGGIAGALVAGLAIATARQLPTVGSDTAIAVVVTSLFGAGTLMALSRASPPGLRISCSGTSSGLPIRTSPSPPRARSRFSRCCVCFTAGCW